MSSIPDEVQKLVDLRRDNDPYYGQVIDAVYGKDDDCDAKALTVAVLTRNDLRGADGAARRLQALHSALSDIDDIDYWGTNNATSVHGIEEANGANVVILDQLWAGVAYQRGLRAPRVILNTHNCEDTLMRAVSRLAPVSSDLVVRVEQYEREIFRRVDEVWVCNNLDGSLVRSKYHIGAHRVPNVASVFPHSSYRNPDGRIVFVGDMRYPPNKVAAQTVVDAMQHLPDKLLHVVSRSGTLDVPADCQFRVSLDNNYADAMANASIFVAPLPRTSGTPIKVLEAWAAEIPVIGSAESVGAIDGAIEGEHYLAASTTVEVASAIRALEIDERRYDIAAAGYELWNARYRPEHMRIAVAERLLG